MDTIQEQRVDAIDIQQVEGREATKYPRGHSRGLQQELSGPKCQQN